MDGSLAAPRAVNVERGKMTTNDKNTVKLGQRERAGSKVLQSEVYPTEMKNQYELLAAWGTAIQTFPRICMVKTIMH